MPVYKGIESHDCCNQNRQIRSVDQSVDQPEFRLGPKFFPLNTPGLKRVVHHRIEHMIHVMRTKNRGIDQSIDESKLRLRS